MESLLKSYSQTKIKTLEELLEFHYAFESILSRMETDVLDG